MPVYSAIDGKIKKLGIVPLSKEKNLQKLVEENLPVLLDMFFIASEYQTTHGGRIDTLAIDSKGAPVIIEYKRNKHDNVITQALFYLNWLKSQKPEFFQMLVIKKLGAESPIDWKNPRVICIAESYNPYDIFALNEISAKLELLKYHYYEGNIFMLENIKGDDEKAQYVEQVIADDQIDESVKQVIQPDLESHLNKGQAFVKDLFLTVQNRIFELDESIDRKINNNYIAFKVSKIFAEVHIQKIKLLIYLRPVKNYNDPENRIDQIPDTYNWSLNQRIYINNEHDIDYVMNLVEQSYKDVL
ncbi:DUF5655 domain-containing protein [Mucilaginibacter sp. OK098]|uniref:DUF5655 domain-containing protein n=1 Tax=Mucilaginibacter sp. OK098 TaxID=1855297 RepID=UPI000912AC40|nr:DUF5655 domain-containing protein [Mucilaginibacter sp. OK098]SHM42580.1 Predicted transport protein [Mucilaginibacter sp. OK098]